ncbi:MAG: SWIM zinc finger domain-containing protein, partial [Planctomycetota bacterium]
MMPAKGSKLAAMMGRRLRSHLKEKGRKYYSAGKVQLQESGPGFARAIVRGTSDYIVNLTWDAGITMDCSCPFFREHNSCKHIWAVVLTAERGEPKKKQGSRQGGGKSRRWRDILALLPGPAPVNGIQGKPDPNAWEFVLQVLRSKKGHRYLVQGALVRGEERRRLVEPEEDQAEEQVAEALAEGAEAVELPPKETPVITGPGAAMWVPLMQAHPRFVVPGPESGEFLDRVMSMQPVPRLLLPRDLRFKQVAFKPVPCLVVRKPTGSPDSEKLEAELFCDYDGVRIPAKPFAPGRYDPRVRRFLLRDPSAENAFWLRLLQVGLTRDPQSPGGLSLHQG